MSSAPAAGARTVEFLVRSAGLGKGLGAGDAEGARGGKILHLADHRRLDTLASAEQVYRPPVRCQGQALREVAGAVGGDRDRHRRLTRIGAGVENVVPKTR